ncbi:MAG: hypothetical protein AAF682_06315 [Planctomycetota bacterium]
MRLPRGAVRSPRKAELSWVVLAPGTGGLLQDNFRYVELPQPIPLAAGSTYTIAGAGRASTARPAYLLSERYSVTRCGNFVSSNPRR